MKYKQGTRRKAIEYEKDLVAYWKKHKTFEKSVENRPAANSYVFYDGPPFITGVPHHGTLLTSIVKDAVPRYWTMKGKRVERVWGWDCHGLPAEVFTEKKLGIKDRRDIGTKITLEQYIKTCRDNMVQTGSLWEDTIDRVGRWVDFKGAYKTMDKDYMESVWWAFKVLYESGKIYEGEKVLLYCTRDATPLSKAEVAMDNSYQDVTDPSVYVKFKLVGDDAYLLAWTTTPWSLPADVALAVNKDVEYVKVAVGDDKLILAKELLKRVLTNEKHEPLDYEVLKTFKGKDLVGKDYEPLFDTHLNAGENLFKIWHADFVHTDEGTGIAHEAPAYGEEDYGLSRKEGFPIVLDIDESGFYTSGPWKGQNIWEANKQIAKELHKSGVVWKIEYITHSYPHCHRCHTRLMYRAHPSWFMDIDSQRTQMLELNSDIQWYPEHIKRGRFEKTVQSAPDWNLSRDRFWATAMPVWKGKDKEGREHVKVVGSYKELKELSGVELEDYHRPWIDDVGFTIDDIVYKRIDKVLDCWFESGSMPFAQFHYPFENAKKFEENYPGDFVVEYVPQVRAWFYYLHAVSTGLFGKPAFRTALVHGTLAGNDGRKMSKSYGNYTDPNDLMDTYSADSLRFLLLSSPVLNGEDYSLLDKDVADVSRKLNMIWNMYDFFTLYADVDKWEWDGNKSDPSSSLNNILDRWIVSRVHSVTSEVDSCMQKYDLPGATKPLLELLDDASNWYVRRSRKRFWKSENTDDKQDAYRALHYVLLQTAIIFAPFTPFLSEELYRNLTGDESVHLLDWPEVGHVNDALLDNMAFVRKVINDGLSLRAAAKIKVRQPLSKVTVSAVPEAMVHDIENFKLIIQDELNVKDVIVRESSVYKVTIDTKLSKHLKLEGYARELIRHIQAARKSAGLLVDDRIELAISTNYEEFRHAAKLFVEEIQKETLALKLLLEYSGSDFKKEYYSEKVKIEGHDVDIYICKTININKKVH